MDCWYVGNELVVPEDQESFDWFPSPETWSKWGMINESENCVFPNKGFVFYSKWNHEELDYSSDIFSNEESCIHDKDRHSSSISGGRTSSREEYLHQNASSSDQQLDSISGFEQMDDIFFSLPVDELPGTESLSDSFCFEPEFENQMVPSTNVRFPSEHNKMNKDVDEDRSLEESVLQELELVMTQLTEKTRICFRDSLYRLAKNTREHVVMQNQIGDVSMGTSPWAYQEEKMRPEGRKAVESETNSIDRAIANLMFNKADKNVHDEPCPAAPTKPGFPRQEAAKLLYHKPEIQSSFRHPVFLSDAEVPNIC